MWALRLRRYRAMVADIRWMKRPDRRLAGPSSERGERGRASGRDIGCSVTCPLQTKPVSHVLGTPRTVHAYLFRINSPVPPVLEQSLDKPDYGSQNAQTCFAQESAKT
jgi:hypothetical protein